MSSFAIKRLCVIVNPASGGSDDRERIFGALTDAGIVFDIVETKGPGDAARVAQKVSQAKYDAVAVAGGDGTVAEVAHGMYDRDLPLVILPVGTANALAHELQQPVDVETTVRSLASGSYTTSELDIPVCNDKPFVIDMHFGVVKYAFTNIHPRIKSWFGTVAYAGSMARWLRKTPLVPYEFEVDGRKYAARAVYFLVANSTPLDRFGLRLFRSRSSSDGKLDVVAITTRSFFKLAASYISLVLFRRPLRRTVIALQGSDVLITRCPAEAMFDDAVVAAAPPQHITMGSMKLKVIIPV